MSIAANAKAKLEIAAQEAAAKVEVAAAPRVAIKRAVRPDRPVPSPASTAAVMSPARQRKAFLVAATAGAVLAAAGVAAADRNNQDQPPLEGEAARMLQQLQDDQARLKLIQSTERKIELKRELLPAYDGWCAGVLAGGRGERGPLDQIFTTVMIWRIDTGDFLEALQMAEHVFRYGLAMPARIARTAATFVVEEVSDAAIRAYDAGGQAAIDFPAAILPMLQDLIDQYDEDLHDEVHARLHKALGRAIMAGAVEDDADDLAARRAQTLRCYQRALELNPKVGVKKDVEQLQRQIAKGGGASSSAVDAQTKTDLEPDTLPPGG